MTRSAAYAATSVSTSVGQIVSDVHATSEALMVDDDEYTICSPPANDDDDDDDDEDNGGNNGALVPADDDDDRGSDVVDGIAINRTLPVRAET